MKRMAGLKDGSSIMSVRTKTDLATVNTNSVKLPTRGPLKGLLTLALGVKTIVKKQREVWMFNHTRIHLDTVADLGQFVELETVFQGQTEAEAINEHQHVKAVLHLDIVDPIAVSYSDLVMRKS